MTDERQGEDKKAIERLTANLIAVPVSTTHWAEPELILDDEKYSYFRGCPGNKSIFIRNAAPGELSQEDIETLNARCDEKERPRNRKVKSHIAGSLSRYFGQMAFHVYEIGCGKFPIAPYFSERGGVSYHGIERDRNHLVALHSMDIPASDWRTALRQPPVKDRPSICVAIYALHFMVNSKLPERLKILTNEMGFFVGNFYVDPYEQDSRKQRDKLGAILKKQDMSYIIVDDTQSRANQYWLIAPSGNLSNIHKYAGALQETLPPPKKGPATTPAP